MSVHSLGQTLSLPHGRSQSVTAIATAVAALAMLAGYVAPMAPAAAISLSLMLPWVFLARARQVAVIALVAGLVTISHTMSATTVSAIPICTVGVTGLVIAYRREAGRALRDIPGLRLMLAGWLLWVAWTLIRLRIDYPVYGMDAARDAAPVLDFGAVVLGSALAYGSTRAQARKAVSLLVLLAAGYSLLYPLYLAGVLTNVPLISFANLGITGVAIFGAGLWSPRTGRRAALLVAGLAVVAVSQSRMGYIAVAILTIVFLISRGSEMDNGRPTRGTRVGSVACLVYVLLALALLLPRVPNLSGRIGAISIDVMVKQMSQVADPDGDDAGSVGDRNRWWSRIMAEMTAQPANIQTGMGLGKDLLNGFRAGHDGPLVRKPHNDVLEWFAREGILGLAAVTSFLTAALVCSWRSLRLDPGNSALFGWTVAAVVAALSQPYLSYSHGVIPLTLILGYTMGIGALARQKDQSA